MNTGIISTAAGTGMAGYGGDGGPAPAAQLRQPHCVVRDKDGSLLICDLANHRIRRFTRYGVIETWAGTGEGAATPEGAPVSGNASERSAVDRAVAEWRSLCGAARGECDSAGGCEDAYISSHRGYRRNGIFRRWRPGSERDVWRQRYRAGSGAGWSEGLGAGARWNALRGRYRQPCGPQSRFPKTGIITTILGTGMAGDGPETNPPQCRLTRPHAVLFSDGKLYVADSEAHRIRLLSQP